jgi:hypothetical protein
MAIVFINQTMCSICCKELKKEDKIFSFPPFVQNTKDPFYQFNDTACHIECLKNHPLGNMAIKFAREYFLKTRPENRICYIGNNLISNSDDYIFLDLLTSNEAEELHAFNFTTLDRSNLKKWDKRDKFLKIASKFRDNGKWGDFGTYKYLDRLIDSIKG